VGAKILEKLFVEDGGLSGLGVLLLLGLTAACAGLWDLHLSLGLLLLHGGRAELLVTMRRGRDGRLGLLRLRSFGGRSSLLLGAAAMATVLDRGRGFSLAGEADLVNARCTVVVLGAVLNPVADGHGLLALNVGLAEEAAAAEHILLDRALDRDARELVFRRGERVGPAQVTG
jgi:hypothetical protein